jgi:hypothetical protein
VIINDNTYKVSEQIMSTINDYGHYYNYDRPNSKKHPVPNSTNDRGLKRIFSISMPKLLVKGIDEIRGDTSRSLWLQRAAIKELECQKKEMLLNGVPDHSAATSSFSVVSTANQRLLTHGDGDTDER